MTQTSTPVIHPAVTCPAWCSASDEPDHLTVWPNGDWDVLHLGEPAVVETGEEIVDGLPDRVEVMLESFASGTPSSNYTNSIGLTFVMKGVALDNYVLTARQALRLAEVLVQQATAILAEETMTTAAAVTR